MANSVRLFAAIIFLCAFAGESEQTHVCSVNRPVVGRGETVELRAWTNSPRIDWTVSSGTVTGSGKSLTWQLPQQTGRHVATATFGQPSEKCSVTVFVVSASRALGGRETGWLFLLRGQAEQRGYGLYSYFLLGAPPDENSRERILKAIEAYLRLTPSLAELEPLLERRELNANQVPVDSPIPDKVTPQWLLDRYDYARARAILAKVDSSLRKGPYLISTLKTASEQQQITGAVLFQDLSLVPPHLVASWYEMFLNQAAQERFWEERRLQQIALRMRTVIAVLAIGLPEVQGALEQWIRWSK
jgi:hypothetical protein